MGRTKMTTETKVTIENAFRNFDKWDTYNLVFALMTLRRCTLQQIQEIASDPAHDPEFQSGISPEVIAMRRRDVVIGHAGGLDNHRRWVISDNGQRFIAEQSAIFHA